MGRVRARAQCCGAAPVAAQIATVPLGLATLFDSRLRLATRPSSALPALEAGLRGWPDRRRAVRAREKAVLYGGEKIPTEKRGSEHDFLQFKLKFSLSATALRLRRVPGAAREDAYA